MAQPLTPRAAEREHAEHFEEPHDDKDRHDGDDNAFDGGFHRHERQNDTHEHKNQDEADDRHAAR